MKTLYIDCSMGAAGDMLTAALLELLPSREEFIKRLNGLGIPGVVFAAEPSVKCGITGTHMTVTVSGEEEESHDHNHEHAAHTHDHENHAADVQHHHASDHHDVHDHHHSSLHDIEHIVRGHLSLHSKVQDQVMAIYKIIADAESQVHGVPVTDIHFHEVGTMDAIADISAVCLLLNEIAPDKVVVSPIHVGSGQVRCAHGVLPVPAPATALILKDVPIYGGAIKGELCTPTGAAILKHFASQFGPMPVMKTTAIGYGMGKKDFEAANCVRAILGETAEVTQAYAEGETRTADITCAADSTGARDRVSELRCNLDDMTGEEIGFAMETLLEAGALDVYTVPIGMKKSRPGVMLCVLCKPEAEDNMAQLLLRHTTTIGVRKESCSRWVLDRESITRQTTLGPVRVKRCTGYGVEKEKPEYDDLVRLAREKGLSLAEVKAMLEHE